jgi:hypothetical protein
MFNVNDYVFIRPTGNPEVDSFLDQQLTVIDIITVNNGEYHWTQYELINAAGDTIIVNSDEVEKGVRLNGE